MTIASRDAALAGAFVAALGSPRFRPYRSTDPIGVEIGGAVKNVLAIACGIVEGRGLGDNARAALITRGLAEMVRLGVAKGGRGRDVPRPVGAGRPGADLHRGAIAQYALGSALGRGESLDEALAGRRSVVEGVATAAAVARLAAHLGVEMPITAAVDAVLAPRHRDRCDDRGVCWPAPPRRMRGAAGPDTGAVPQRGLRLTVKGLLRRLAKPIS